MSATSRQLSLVCAAAILAGGAQAADGFGFSGSLRERGTYISADAFDESAENTGWWWTQRLTVGAVAPVSEDLEFHGTLVSALQSGRPSSPVERNNLDLQEAYLQWTPNDLSLRAGRQEVRLGSQRLVAWREGTNVRRTWDGVRLGRSSGANSLDLFGLQLVSVTPDGAFNDTSDGDDVLAGAYFTRLEDLTGFDLYYLFSGRNDRATIEGVEDQDRHSVGARLFGERGRLFWNWEAVYQFGEHGDADIDAWTVASHTGLRFGGPWAVEVMLSANVASGDSDPEDGKLETFDALYPRGSYFSELALLGPSNFHNINPYLTFAPRPSMVVTVDANFYYRLEKSDGVYGPPGNLLRPPGTSDARAVNRAYSVNVEWALTRRWLTSISVTHSRPQRFVEETGPADNTNFVELTLSARF